jgi:hypothetical protein
MKAVYAHGDQWRADVRPGRAADHEDTLFDLQRYHGGALVLYALRQKIGDAAFQRIERAYVDRFKDQSVSTDDYIALATQISGDRSVTPFLRDWLYGTKTPEDARPPGLDRESGRDGQGTAVALRAGRAERKRSNAVAGSPAVPFCPWASLPLPLVIGTSPATRRVPRPTEDAPCPAVPSAARAVADFLHDHP